MTKKHFIALARALEGARPTSFNGPITEDSAASAAQVAALHQWEACCDEIATVCAHSNPNFNRTKFLTACGIED